jgi:hypothetical protein
MVAVQRHRSAGRTVGEFAFGLAALTPMVAMLAIPIPVLDDVGLHLASASALGYQMDGEFADVLSWRPGLPPNLTVELALRALLWVLPPVWAAKTLVAAVLIGFAWAARRLVVAAGVAAPWALALLPFAWHRPLALGFLDFSAAVVPAMLAVALVLRRPTRPPVAALAALLTLTWFTHLVPALVATGVCAAVVVAGLVIDRRERPDARPWPAVRGLAWAAAPVLLLTAAFVLLNPPPPTVAQPGSALRRIVSVLAMIKAEVSLVRAEYVVFGLVALVLYAVAAAILVVRLREDRRVRTVDALLVCALLGAIGSVVSPEGVSGGAGNLGMRVALFPPLLLATWVVAHLGTGMPCWSFPARAGVAAVMGVATLLLVAVRLPAQAEYSSAVAETLELSSCLPERSTVLQLDLGAVRPVAVQADPLSQQVGFLTTERRSLDMSNESGWVPYYLWRFRDGQSPDRVLATEPGGVSSRPHRIDLAGALRRGERLDAVLLVGRSVAGPEVLADAPTQQMLADVAANYTHVATSSGGASELWLRNGIRAGCGRPRGAVVNGP